MSPAVTVTGGANSISADFEDLAAFAASLSSLARDLAEHSLRTARVAVDPSLYGSAVLDPTGAAVVASQIPRTVLGLAAASATAEWLTIQLRAACQAYLAVDDLRTQASPLAHGLLLMPRVLGDLVIEPFRMATGHARGLQAVIADDPYLADVLVVAGAEMVTVGASVVRGGLLGAGLLSGGLLGGGLVSAARFGNGWGPASAVQGVTGAASQLYADGSPVLHRPEDLATDDHFGPPRDVEDLMRALSVRNSSEANPRSGGGIIDIRFVLHADGHRSVIVDLPGTTRWNVEPGQSTPQVGDFGTNLRGLSGKESVYERGIVAALRDAGVGADEPILLVAHSQGGLVAAHLASDLSASKEFRVTHLLTAGSPLGLAKIPKEVSVLAVENRGDVVPHLDGRSNRARPNLTTVTVDRGAPTVLQKHSLDAYEEGARDIDASTDQSLAAWHSGAGEFLDGDSVRTVTYQVRRAR